MLAYAFIQQANNFTKDTKPLEAADLFSKALQIADSLSVDEVAFLAWNGLSYLYQSLEVWDKAVEAGKRSLILAEKTGNNALAVDAYYRLACAYANMDSYTDASYYFSQAEKGYAQNSDTEKIISCYIDNALMNMRQVKYNEASLNLDYANSMAIVYNNASLRGNVLQVYGSLQMLMGAYSKAEDFF